MDPEIAVRLASTVVPNVSVPDAQRVIVAFLGQLTVCTVCDGQGEITVKTKVFTVPVPARVQGTTLKTVTVDQGETVPCPQCAQRGHDDEVSSVGKDPQYVVWYCATRSTDAECWHARREGAFGEHTDCGLRVMLPLDLLKPAGGS